MLLSRVARDGTQPEAWCHAVHWRQLPDLVRLADLVENLHTGERGAPDGLAALLRRLTGEMEIDVEKEKLLVFPLIRQGADVLPVDRIVALRADRDDLAEHGRLENEAHCPPFESHVDG